MPAAALLASLGGGLVVAGVAAQQPAPPDLPATPPVTAPGAGAAGALGAAAVPGARAATGAAAPTPAPRRTRRPDGPALPASVPVRLSIPKLDVDADLVRLGLAPDQTVQVPEGGTHVGWFAGGPTPGARGPAVLAGHVTWDRRPAVFFRLAELRPGDPVEVTRADGTVARFSITEVARYPKADFPTLKVYGNTRSAALRLITCGGAYDRQRNRHLDNVVAYATLVGSRSA